MGDKINKQADDNIVDGGDFRLKSQLKNYFGGRLPTAKEAIEGMDRTISEMRDTAIVMHDLLLQLGINIELPHKDQAEKMSLEEVIEFTSKAIHSMPQTPVNKLMAEFFDMLK